MFRIRNHYWARRHVHSERIHSRSQRQRSFWSAPIIGTSGIWKGKTPEFCDSRTSRHSARVQSQLQQIWLAENTKRLLCACYENWTLPEIAILSADDKKRGPWWLEYERFDDERRQGFSCSGVFDSAHCHRWPKSTASGNEIATTAKDLEALRCEI